MYAQGGVTITHYSWHGVFFFNLANEYMCLYLYHKIHVYYSSKRFETKAGDFSCFLVMRFRFLINDAVETRFIRARWYIKKLFRKCS